MKNICNLHILAGSQYLFNVHQAQTVSVPHLTNIGPGTSEKSLCMGTHTYMAGQTNGWTDMPHFMICLWWEPVGDDTDLGTEPPQSVM